MLREIVHIAATNARTDQYTSFQGQSTCRRKNKADPTATKIAAILNVFKRCHPWS